MRLLLLMTALLSLTSGITSAQTPPGLTEPEGRLLDQRAQSGAQEAPAPLPAFFGDPDLKSFRTPGGVFWSKDSDKDGLKDDEEKALGADPLNRDTDGDGLPDGWEVHGVNDIDLRALGASPLHKDIFVHMDYMERASARNGLGPNPAVIAGIFAAFADASVSNPDGVSGINIHLIMGSKLAYVGDMNPVETVFQQLKVRNFDPKRAPIFHYMIWGDTYDGSTSSGYSLTIPGSDFIVTLGAWHDGDGGTDNEKIGTFVHELGHNLGLRHGNFDDDNYKPNHLSVMNYAFQTAGVRRNGGRRYTYQWLNLPALDERALDEMVGLGAAPELLGSSTIWFHLGPNVFVEADIGGGIDWDQKGGVNPQVVDADLNGDSGESLLGATTAEWPQLRYNGGAIGQTNRLKGLAELPFARAPLAPKYELTLELNRRLQDRRVAVPSSP